MPHSCVRSSPKSPKTKPTFRVLRRHRNSCWLGWSKQSLTSPPAQIQSVFFSRNAVHSHTTHTLTQARDSKAASSDSHSERWPLRNARNFPQHDVTKVDSRGCCGAVCPGACVWTRSKLRGSHNPDTFAKLCPVRPPTPTLIACESGVSFSSGFSDVFDQRLSVSRLGLSYWFLS